MRSALYITLIVLVLAGAAAWRQAASNRQLKTTTHNLQRALAEREQTIVDLQIRIEELETGTTAQVNPKIPGDPAVALAMEAEIQKRLAEAGILKSNATELVTALVAANELPEAPETPEQGELRRAEISVLQKHLEEARKNSAEAYNRTKELLITMNIPPEIAAMRNDKALASVEVQHFWPFFEARKESEIRQTLVERLKMRLLNESIAAEAAEVQRKMAAQKAKP